MEGPETNPTKEKAHGTVKALLPLVKGQYLWYTINAFFVNTTSVVNNVH
jgi:hypothetical protein